MGLSLPHTLPSPRRGSWRDNQGSKVKATSVGVSRGQVRPASAGFGRVLNLARFGQVPSEPRPNLPDPGRNCSGKTHRKSVRRRSPELSNRGWMAPETAHKIVVRPCRSTRPAQACALATRRCGTFARVATSTTLGVNGKYTQTRLWVCVPVNHSWRCNHCVELCGGCSIVKRLWSIAGQC